MVDIVPGLAPGGADGDPSDGDTGFSDTDNAAQGRSAATFLAVFDSVLAAHYLDLP
jgi:hypothetical protein